MKRLFKFLVISVMLIGVSTLQGCKKEGCTNYLATNYDMSAKKDNGTCLFKSIEADFTYHVSTSIPGKVTFTNLTTGGYQYQWKFGDGKESIQENPTHYYSENGVYTVKFIVKDMAGNESSKTATIVINNINNNPSATTGQYIFWIATPDYGAITVTVNGGNVGTITVYSTSGLSPDCGTSGYVTIERPAGSYSIKATNSAGDLWETTVQISNGVCKKMQFT